MKSEGEYRHGRKPDKHDIDYHKKEWAEEVERTATCNAWNKALFESLK